VERVGRLAEHEAIRIIAHTAQGLHKAHKLGLIHRDVKPDNILLTKDGKVKLADMGLVKELEADSNLTRTGRGLGTPYFMAPEQFRNAKNADVRCDIYSLAATLYHAVTGQMPFKACSPLDAWMKKIHNDLAPPRALNPDLSERIDWAIRRAMSPDPALRPASCREFVEDLTGQSTRKLSDIGPSGLTPTDQWYLIYKDEDNVVHTVKGSKSGIRRSLKEGLLGDADNVRISRSKAGPFDPLRLHPEYRDLAVDLNTASGLTQTPKPPKAAPSELDPAETQTPPPGYPDSSVSITMAPISATSPTGPAAPHFDLGTESSSSEWLKWAALILVTLSAGALGFFLMPFLTQIR